MRLIALPLGLAFAAVSSAQLLSYDFSSNAQGWRRANLNPSTLELTVLGGATWNSGGYIDADDFSNWAFHLSPDLSGGFSGAQAIRFDYSSASGDAPYPFLVLRSQTEAIFQVVQVPADGAWHSYEYAFTPGTWQYSSGGAPTVATSGQIQSLLGGLYQIGVSADNSVGAEYTRLDNLALVPEPGTLVALSFGGLLLRRRKS